MSITLTQINNALYNTFNVTSVTNLVPYTQNIGTLTEGLANTPCFQVYWELLNPVSEGSSTDRRTFGGDSSNAPVRTKRLVYHLDVYLDPRNHIDQIFVNMLQIVDAVNDILENQNTKPYFGLAGIKSYTWSCERGSTEYANILYPTVRWVIEIYIF